MGGQKNGWAEKSEGRKMGGQKKEGELLVEEI
jgi:hypothetical protein